MKKYSLLFLFIIIVVATSAQELWVKNNSFQSVEVSDTGVFSFNPNSTAFFDDKEYTSNIKKGYTYPGFIIQPRIKYQPSKNTSISAGFHTLYFAGADTAEKVIPVLSLQVKLFDGVEMILGTIHSQQLHFLPEPLMKPEKLFISQPETGLQFLTTTDRFKGDSWTNWERYIKQGSPFQEVFTMGFAGIIKPNTFETREGLIINIFGFGVHNGGQIDSTNLDVSTMINIGAGLSYSVPIGIGKTNFGVEAMGFLSADVSPNPTSKYQRGNGVYPKIFIESPTFRGELGYWRGSTFDNPRGEELFGSYSKVKPEFDEDIRTLYTTKLIYTVQVAKGFTLGGRLETYIDPKYSLIDWAFTLRMLFNQEIFLRK
ncbi:MAG: hypothetical protein AB9846_04665 [Tenuifilaceae bacterium]